MAVPCPPIKATLPPIKPTAGSRPISEATETPTTFCKTIKVSVAPSKIKNGFPPLMISCILALSPMVVKK